MEEAPKNKVKHDWYQTDSNVVINILIKNLSKDNVKVDITNTSVNTTIKLSNETEYCLDLDLCHPILASESTYKHLSSKVEIKLRKSEALRWPSLEGDGREPSLKSIPSSKVSGQECSLKYPSSSTKQKDWNAIEAQVKKDEEEEKPEGDEALNKMFQKIYGDGSDEVKKAMKKSFVQSGGTVLSTNWGEVKEKEVEIKSPDGMEWRKWDQ